MSSSEQPDEELKKQVEKIAESIKEKGSKDIIPYNCKV